MIKRGGAPLAPREVEEAAAGVPGLRIAAAVGLPPGLEAATEEIAVAVEIDPACEPSRIAEDVAAAIEKALGFAPDRVVVLAPRTLPRTANGKIRHPELPPRADRGGSGAAGGGAVQRAAGGRLRRRLDGSAAAGLRPQLLSPSQGLGQTFLACALAFRSYKA